MMTYEILPTRQEGKDKGDAAAAAGMSCGELAALCTAGWAGVGCGLSGDSWMYPYQRTPMGNPYISPIYPYIVGVYGLLSPRIPI